MLAFICINVFGRLSRTFPWRTLQDSIIELILEKYSYYFRYGVPSFKLYVKPFTLLSSDEVILLSFASMKSQLPSAAIFHIIVMINCCIYINLPQIRSIHNSNICTFWTGQCCSKIYRILQSFVSKQRYTSIQNVLRYFK